MAVAAATAVIAPAAFFSAPAAFATGEENTATTESPSPSESSPAPGTSDGSEGEPTEGASESADETTEPGDGASEPSSGAPETSEPAEPGDGGSPSPSASQESPEPSTSPSTSPSTGPDDGRQECEYDEDENGDVDYAVDSDLNTSLSGLPDKIVAGSGFHSFKLNVSNKSDNAYKRLDLGVFAAQIDEKSPWWINSDHLTLQFKDPESGKWTDISLDFDDEGVGYLGFTDVKAKESFSIDLRLSVDKSAPAGLAYALTIGTYVNDDGTCVDAGGEDLFYEFEIIAAGTDPGKPNDAKPQGGKKPLPVKPAGNNEIKPVGTLAQTGSSSMVPVIGTVGGIAILAGAGVMFAMKRRRDGDATA
ncbi:LPXTG cell wall anchor domain-containing protein [Streptomyces corynorhini]|nr:LPXTG cell wall anchor domain-containing protein [Streptomyces corynorhini]